MLAEVIRSTQIDVGKSQIILGLLMLCQWQAVGLLTREPRIPEDIHIYIYMIDPRVGHRVYILQYASTGCRRR